MQPHVVVQAADGTTHLVPATVSKEVNYTYTYLLTYMGVLKDAAKPGWLHRP